MRFRKEVSEMKYEVTRKFVITATSPEEALEKLGGIPDPIEHQVYEEVRELARRARRRIRAKKTKLRTIVP